MSGWGREGVRPLLRRVADKPHATDEDHEEAATANGPPYSQFPVEIDDEALAQDPVSTDEDGPELPAIEYKPRPGTRTAKLPRKKAPLPNIHAQESSPSKVTPRKSARTAKPKIKDAAPVGLIYPTPIDEFLTTNDKTLVSSWGTQGSQKRKRADQGYGSRASGSSSQKKTQSDTTLDTPKPALQLPQKIDLSARPGLKLPTVCPTLIDGDDAFDDFDEDLLGQLTPPKISELDDVKEIGSLRLSEPLILQLACELCGEPVDKAFKEDFELEQCGGRRMNLRMQESFCQAHTARTAQQTWRARSYPEVDWTKLNDRLQQHYKHLAAIIDQRTHSEYRDALEQKVRDQSTRNVMRGAKSMTDGAEVGYYGSRGAKVMSDYIMKTLSGKLRQSAGSDSIVGAKGVAGGVSGYVQSVLVPELALMLIMDDLDVSKEEARTIMQESTELGQALHQEQDERVYSDDEFD